MIGRLTGQVAETGQTSLILDVGGVGYEVFCAPSTLAEATMQQGPVTLFIDTHVRENEIRLYGFISAAEKSWFVLLQSVQGVGAKVALAMLGTLSTETLGHAISAGDTKTLATTPGVGPKVAQRIAIELKDKAAQLTNISSADSTASAPSTTGAQTGKKGKTTKGSPRTSSKPSPAALRADAVSALVNLGYQPAQASAAVQAAANMAGDKASTEELIRLGLRELST